MIAAWCGIPVAVVFDFIMDIISLIATGIVLGALAFAIKENLVEAATADFSGVRNSLKELNKVIASIQADLKEQKNTSSADSEHFLEELVQRP